MGSKPYSLTVPLGPWWQPQHQPADPLPAAWGHEHLLQTSHPLRMLVWGEEPVPCTQASPASWLWVNETSLLEEKKQRENYATCLRCLNGHCYEPKVSKWNWLCSFLKGQECQKNFLHIDNRCVDHVISGAKVHLNNYSPMPSLPSLPPPTITKGQIVLQRLTVPPSGH